MTRNRARAVIAILGFFAAGFHCSCHTVESEDAATPHDRMVGRTSVDPESFLRLVPGTDWRAAKALLGTTGRHLFTYKHERDTYVLTTYFVENRPDTEGGIAFYGRYKNDVLEGVLRSLPKNLERFPFRRSTASRPKRWKVEDESRILEILAMNVLSRGEIEEILERFAKPRRKSEPNIPPWVWEGIANSVGATAIDAYTARVESDYARNLELKRHFDGFRIKVGMTRSEVRSLLGSPAHTTEVRLGLLLSIYSKKIYGENREEDLRINPLYRFSPVAVVFQNGRATRVYSKGFISRDWMPEGPEYGL